LESGLCVQTWKNEGSVFFTIGNATISIDKDDFKSFADVIVETRDKLEVKNENKDI
jgi:hypothetical protein